jgi:hypothetical protein
MVRKTLKHSKSKLRKTRKNTGMTVEGLHASFEKMDTKVRRMVEKGCTDSSLADCIHRLWSQQFHSDLSHSAIKDLIKHYRSLYTSVKKTRKQRGGSAPIDWVQGQGSTAQVYGRFPVHEGSSSQFVSSLDHTRTYESSIGKECDPTVSFPRQLGGTRRSKKQKQRGGGIFDNLVNFASGGGIGNAVRMGHAPESVPQNTLAYGVSAAQGAPRGGPPSHPVDPAWRMSSFAPRTYAVDNMSQINISPVYTKY